MAVLIDAVAWNQARAAQDGSGIDELLDSIPRHGSALLPLPETDAGGFLHIEGAEAEAVVAMRRPTEIRLPADLQKEWTKRGWRCLIAWSASSRCMNIDYRGQLRAFLRFTEEYGGSQVLAHVDPHCGLR
eukprot:gene15498-14428_t